MRPDRSKEVVSYGRYIDEQVDKTGRQVRLTEVFGGLFLLVVGLLVFFLAAAVIDHWIAPLQAMGRWGLLVLLVGGVSAFAIFRILPLLFRRVNPVYSAHTIERQTPAMKNSLVNTLLLRQEGKGVSKGVRRAVEEQAAQRLSQAPVESAVDRSKLIRLGYLLVALMAVAALYKMVSPKDPLTTWGRIAAPWSDVAAPTRVVIEQVRHSATPGAQGADWVFAEQKPVEVDAFVRGLKPDDAVTLYWSTEDGRVENQPITMQRFGNDGRQYRCLLPDETAGLRQNVRYYVAAGDARSADFRIAVRTPPVLTVKRVDYRFPVYTNKRPESRSGGEIAALAGTLVTLHAEANQDIKSATLDVGCDGTIDHPLQVSGRTATGTFQLALSAADKTANGTLPLAPGLDKNPVEYLVRMTSAAGHENPQPIRYRLEVIADQAPRVRIAQPEATKIDLPLNGVLPVVVKADDPDFALSSVRVTGSLADMPSGLLFDMPIFQDEAESFTKTFSNAESPWQFRPDDARLARPLKVGDKVQIKVTARDNRHNLRGEPEPNVSSDPGAKSETQRLVVTIIAPNNQPGDKTQPKSKPDDKKQDAQEPEKKQDDAKQKQPGDTKQDDGKQGDQKKQDGKKQEEKKQDSGEKKQDDKQAGNKQGNQGDRKEQSKSDNKSGDMKQLFDQLKREAEEERQGKEKSPKEKPSPSGKSEQKKGAGGAGESPDPKEMPPEAAPQSGGQGAKKTPGGGKSSSSGNNPPSERADPRTDNGGETSASKTDDGQGGAKKTGDKFAGQGSEKSKGLPDEMNPPSNPSDTKKPGDKEAGKAKSSDDSSKQPDSSPKLNPEATGKAGSAPNTAVPTKKEADAKQEGPKESKSSVPQMKSGTPNNADGQKESNPTPMGLADQKQKINNQEMPKSKQPDKTEDGKSPTSPSVDQKENKNTSKSGTKDGSHSGGSAPGGGQQGNKKGTGGSGSNEAANDGKGVAQGEGNGETGSGPGTKAKSPKATGSKGDEAGNGSTTRPGDTNPGQAKSPREKSSGGGDDNSGAAGGNGKRDPRGKHAEGDPQAGEPAGQPKAENTPPSDPDLEAAKRAADLVLKHIESHPDEERFKDPRVIEMAKQLRALRDTVDKAGPAGDVARHQLRGLSRSFSTRGMKQDDGAGYSEQRGARDLKAYPLSEYNERSGQRPARKQ